MELHYSSLNISKVFVSFRYSMAYYKGTFTRMIKKFKI